jgi:hypothetical protein
MGDAKGDGSFRCRVHELFAAEQRNLAQPFAERAASNMLI